ncbi:MAG: Holliday junction resolvase [uncultured bacterium]|nr:MAG: Holliday junction resolvase [uncultured bacterium]
MRIIGIDPGTAITGFAIIEIKNRLRSLLDFGFISTAPKTQNAYRLNQIAEDIEALLIKWKPEKAAVEKLYFNKNIKTAISVAEARGVITQQLAKKGIEIDEFGPSEIKSSVCGNGKADKKAVQKMVTLLMNLKKTPKPDDVADAIAVALCCANKSNFTNNQ